MDISVKHGEVRAFASNMNQWAQQMQSLRSGMMARVSQLESQWRDPQYHVFVDVAKTHAMTLGSAAEQLSRMSKELNLISQELERTQQIMQQRINNMR